MRRVKTDKECRVCHKQTTSKSGRTSICHHCFRDEEVRKKKAVRSQYSKLILSWKDKDENSAEEAAFDLIEALEDYLGKV